MSETDSFIEEVSEEVRRDRLWGYVRRFGWVAVLLVLVVVGATAWNEFRKANAAAEAEKLGDAVVAATREDSAEARAAALAEVVPDAGEAAVIVQMRRAAVLLEAGDASGARAIYEAMAAETADPIYSDLAQLKALILGGDDVAAEDKLAILDGLAAPGAPFRPLALEQKAILSIETGDQETAIAILTELLEDSQSTDTLRGRATQLLIALGGEVPATSRLLTGQ